MAIAGAIAAIVLGITTNIVSDKLPPWLVENVILTWGAFGAATLGCLTIAAWQLTPGNDTTSLEQGTMRQLYRELMIQRQRSIWIDGVLHHSLESVSKIELGLEERPGALELPWNLVLREANSQSRKLNRETSITQIFDMSGGTLLILGDPGAGKTTLMLELTATLLQRAADNQQLPIPVVFSLSTWGRTREPLDQWLEKELQRRYTVPRRLARQWLDKDLILPLLDGLDEVRPDQRGSCVKAINEHLQGYGPMQIVVCSRLSEYEKGGARLRLGTAVFIQPLTSEQVMSYLDSTADQLTGLRLAVEQDDSLLTLISTPLLLSIATLAYRNVSLEKFERANHRKQLIEQYVSRALQRRSSLNQYPDTQVVRWLSELAFQMTRHDQVIYHVEWTQPTWISSRALKAVAMWTFPALLGALTALITGFTIDYANRLGAQLFGLGNDVYIAGISAGWLAGIAIGGLVTVSAFDRTIQPAETISWSWEALRANARRQLRSGLTAGTVLAIIIAAIMHVWGIATAVAFAVLFEAMPIVFYLVIGGISPALRDVHTVPNEGIRRSMRNALIVGIPAGALVGTAIGLAFGARMTLLFGIIDGLTVGMSIFLLTALHSGGKAWLHHIALHMALWSNDKIPFRWIRFLEYSTEHILLRRVGGGYTFIHRLFLEHFAALRHQADATVGGHERLD
jgi:hypothetical protein